jgi:hypothetical protein
MPSPSSQGQPTDDQDLTVLGRSHKSWMMLKRSSRCRKGCRLLLWRWLFTIDLRMHKMYGLSSQGTSHRCLKYIIKHI